MVKIWKIGTLLNLLIIGLFIGMLFSISLVSANGIKLLCLDKGQKVQFSKCNDLIADRVCTTNSGCQFCVNEVSRGVYCPMNVNNCNSGGFSCSSLESLDVVPVQNTNTNTNTNTQTNNTNTGTNTNTNTNTQTNTNTGTNTNTNTQTNTNSNTQINTNSNTNTNSQTNTNTNTNSNTITIKPKIGTGIQSPVNSGSNIDDSISNSDDSNTIDNSGVSDFSFENPVVKMLTLSMILEFIVAVYVLMIFSKVNKKVES